MAKKRKKNHGKKTKKTPSRTKKDIRFDNRGMYKSISIEGFRLFEKIDIDNLSRVNLFFGGNNTGKTSILEAIYTHACGRNFKPFQDTIIFRRRSNSYESGFEIGDSFMGLFNKFSNPFKFKISATTTDDNDNHVLECSFLPSRELRDLDPLNFGEFPGNYFNHPKEQLQHVEMIHGQFRINQGPIYPVGEWTAKIDGGQTLTKATYPDPKIKSEEPFKMATIHDILSHRKPKAALAIFSYLKRYDRLSNFVQEISKAFNTIKDIDMIPYPDGKTSSIYITGPNGRKLPISTLGDGARRWFHIVGHMLVESNACHLIEEVDSTFHPAAHKHLSTMLLEYAEKFNNQLFLTSHSIEFADAFLNILYGEEGIISEDDEDPVRVFTLRNDEKKGIEVWSLSGRESYKNRILYDLEIR